MGSARGSIVLPPAVAEPFGPATSGRRAGGRTAAGAAPGHQKCCSSRTGREFAVIQQCVGVVLALLMAGAPALARPQRHALGMPPGVRSPALSAAGEELIVCYHPRCKAPDRAILARRCGALRSREGYGSAYHVLSLAPGRSAAQEAQRLRSDPRIRF